jgi:hypothetical protein
MDPTCLNINKFWQCQSWTIQHLRMITVITAAGDIYNWRWDSVTLVPVFHSKHIEGHKFIKSYSVHPVVPNAKCRSNKVKNQKGLLCIKQEFKRHKIVIFIMASSFYKTVMVLECSKSLVMMRQKYQRSYRNFFGSVFCMTYRNSTNSRGRLRNKIVKLLFYISVCHVHLYTKNIRWRPATDATGRSTAGRGNLSSRLG